MIRSILLSGTGASCASGGGGGSLNLSFNFSLNFGLLRIRLSKLRFFLSSHLIFFFGALLDLGGIGSVGGGGVEAHLEGYGSRFGVEGR